MTPHHDLRADTETLALSAALLVTVGLDVASPGARWPLSFVAALVAVCLVLRLRGTRAAADPQMHRWQHLASHDPLTGLPNRVTFVDRLERTWERSRDVAVLYIDLDGFKEVNDTLGHGVGDDLLVQVAHRLSASVRERDVVARFGGDEFVAFLADCGRADAHEVAERLRASLSAPYRVHGREVVVSASIGLCPPGSGSDPEEAMRQADLALYRAKGEGRDQVCEYDHHLASVATTRQAAAAEIEAAIGEGRLHLMYQPEIDLVSGDVVSVEALVRVDQAPGHEIPLDLLLTAADDLGLASHLTEWVVDHALADTTRWRALGWEGRVCVNVSGRQLAEGDLVGQVTRLLVKHGLPGSTLTLEFSESGLRELREGSARVLDRLRDCGIGATLDDFGTGPSSLALLQRFPWDCLKVDRSLVAVEAGLAAPLARMAGDLGHVVIAEGIETPDQLAEQRAAGVRRGQGYLLAAPLRPEDVEPVLAVGQVRLPA